MSEQKLIRIVIYVDIYPSRDTVVSEAKSSMTWICANCGEKHEDNNPPCKNCAHGQFAQLDQKDVPERIESTESVEWRCKECGTQHVNNNPPCKNCNNMHFELVKATSSDSIDNGSKSDMDTGRLRKTRVTATKITVYLIGLLTLFGGLLYLLVGSPLFGAPLVITGVITIPFTRGIIMDKFNLELSRGAILLQYILAWITALMFS